VRNLAYYVRQVLLVYAVTHLTTVFLTSHQNISLYHGGVCECVRPCVWWFACAAAHAAN